MAYSEPLFIKTVELLLTGSCICQWSHLDVYEYLDNEDNREKVDNWLKQMGRMLLPTTDEKGVYAGYANVDGTVGRRMQARAVLADTVNVYEGFLEWIKFLKNIQDNLQCISAGDKLSEGELLQLLETSSTAQQKLAKLMGKFKIQKPPKTYKAQLRSILNALKTRGYFNNKKSDTVFVATGKWSLLYDQFRFITQNEGIKEIESEPESMELF